MSTTDENKIAILAELWMSYRNDPDFEDFFEYNDIGLPLAYALDNDIVLPTDVAQGLINETFSLLLAGLEIPEDIEYDSLEHIFDESGDEGKVSTDDN